MRYYATDAPIKASSLATSRLARINEICGYSTKKQSFCDNIYQWSNGTRRTLSSRI